MVRAAVDLGVAHLNANKIFIGSQVTTASEGIFLWVIIEVNAFIRLFSLVCLIVEHSAGLLIPIVLPHADSHEIIPRPWIFVDNA